MMERGAGHDAMEHPSTAMAHRFRDGDPDALRQAWQAHGSLIYTMALRGLNNAADAEDVTQQTFVAAWRGRQRLSPDEHALVRWLCGIARHRIADQLAARSRDRRDVDAMHHLSRQASPPHAGDLAADRVAVAQALRDLGEPRASVVWMAHAEGYSATEIAQRLDIPVGTVKSHLRRGMAHLRSYLEEVSDDDLG